MTQEALKLALEGVEIHSPNSPEYIVCAALIEALAQTQEPVKYSDYEPDGVHHNKPKQDTIQRLSALVRTQQITIDKLEAQTQEPVALQYPQKDIDWQREQQIKAQASTPPQRTWVGLTDEEIEAARIRVFIECGADLIPVVAAYFARAIEAKLKDKNT